METKHTPAPWQAWPIPNDRLKRLAVVCVNDKNCPGAGKQIVADDIRTQADALLIAAAPELLEALKMLVASQDESEHMQDERSYKQLRAATDNARAAIAKATGSAV
jgi:hypothetical protein